LKVAATETDGARISAWSAPSLLFLTIALAIAGSFWIVPIVASPDKSPDGLVLFREAGDCDYLPQVAWAAHLKLGENAVKEYAGTGVRSFPFVPVTIHAILYRVAGSTGFILADLSIVILYACLLRQFLLLAEVARRPAEILSLAVISGAAPWLMDRVTEISHHSMPVLFWDFRFVRPSVTEAVFVLALILATMLIARRQRPIWLFVLFGASFAADFQSDIYSAFDLAFVVGAVSIFVLVASRDRWAAARGVLAAAASTAIACLPFVYQQLHTSPDVKRRWGVYTTRRYGTLLPGLNVTGFALMSVIVAVALAILYRSRDRKRGRLAALSVVTTATAASIVSGPAWLAVLHQTVQIYHFWRQTMLTIGYALLLYTGWLLTDFREIFPLRRLPEKRWSILTTSAGVLFVGFCLFTAYSSSMQRNSGDAPTASAMLQNLNLDHYRTDFRELHRILDRPEYADAAVLGTFDRQLSNWWLYRGRYLYTVETFNSTLPDSVMEARAFQFLRLVGTSNEELGHLLDNPYFLIQIMGLDKYQADSNYTAWPLSDYSPDAQQRIASTTWPFNLELPLSERSRLMKAYEQTAEISQPANALDLIVLDKDSLRGYVHPEQGNRFHLAWSDETFELWVPNNPGLASRVR
jgi:hypothetical protein